MTRGYREARWGVDPLGRYPANYPSRVERNAQRVLELRPDATVERTRDAIQLDWGGRHGLVVLVTADAFEFRLPTVEWPHPHEPAAGSRLWRRRSAESLSQRALGRLLAEAQAARDAQFNTCRFCGRSVPPEHRHAADVCDGCAELHLGVVH